MAEPLAREVVEIAQRGAQQVNREIDGLRTRLQRVEAQAKRANQSLDQMGKSAQASASRAGTAFDAAAGRGQARGGRRSRGIFGDVLGAGVTGGGGAGVLGALGIGGAAAGAIAHRLNESISVAGFRGPLQGAKAGALTGLGPIGAGLGASAGAVVTLGKLIGDATAQSLAQSDEMARFNEALRGAGDGLARAFRPAIDAVSSALEMMTPVLERFGDTVEMVTGRMLEQARTFQENINAKLAELGIPITLHHFDFKRTNPRGTPSDRIRTEEPQRGFEDITDLFKRLALAAGEKERKDRDSQNLQEMKQVLQALYQHFLPGIRILPPLLQPPDPAGLGP